MVEEELFETVARHCLGDDAPEHLEDITQEQREQVMFALISARLEVDFTNFMVRNSRPGCELVNANSTDR